MEVTVKLLGALGRSDPRAADGTLQLPLPDGATAEDLLGRLAARFGEPFGEALQEGGAGSVRVFVGGQLVQGRDQPLAPPGTSSQKVMVVLMSPIRGGR